jgi:hypothetical protein
VGAHQLGDAIGWLPTSYLESKPPPLEHVAQLEAQVADLQAKLDAAQREAGEHRGHIEQLSTADAERAEAMRRLSEENRDLRAGERWPYLVTGAASSASASPSACWCAAARRSPAHSLRSGNHERRAPHREPIRCGIVPRRRSRGPQPGAARRVVGFDSLWSAIIAFHADPGFAGDARLRGRRDERITLGTSVYLLPLRHPTLIAKTTATVDLCRAAGSCWRRWGGEFRPSSKRWACRWPSAARAPTRRSAWCGGCGPKTASRTPADTSTSAR